MLFIPWFQQYAFSNPVVRFPTGVIVPVLLVPMSTATTCDETAYRACVEAAEARDLLDPVLGNIVCRWLLYLSKFPAIKSFIIDRVVLAKQGDNALGSVHPSAHALLCQAVKHMMVTRWDWRCRHNIIMSLSGYLTSGSVAGICHGQGPLAFNFVWSRVTVWRQRRIQKKMTRSAKVTLGAPMCE